MARKQDLRCSERRSFAAALLHLGLGREVQEDYTKMRDSKAGLDHRTVKKGSYDFEGYYFWHFKGTLI